MWVGRDAGRRLNRSVIEIAERTVLATPPEETYELVCDFARLVEWDPAVVASQRVAGNRLEPGSHYSVRVRFLGRTPIVNYELLAAERDRRVEYEARAAWITARDTIVLEPSGPGTLLDARTRMQMSERLAPLARVIGPLVRRQARASIERLIAVCESRARARSDGAPS
jgi:uncharacterized protein YndB with AHSA1/START domain